MSEEKKSNRFGMDDKDPYTLDVVDGAFNVNPKAVATFEYRLREKPEIGVNIIRYPDKARIVMINSHRVFSVSPQYIEDMTVMLDAVSAHVYQINKEIHKSKFSKFVDIEDLGLSVRVTNRLFRADIRDVGTLCRMDFKKLQNTRGIGEKAIKEIAETLRNREYSFEWSGEFDEWVNTKEDE